MRIAILAYGSLVWDEERLAPHITGGWHMGKGPALPVEFCRVSPKRKKALVLAIDPQQGHDVKTSYTLSRRTDIAQAVADLARRERCDERHIGICMADGNHHNTDETLAMRVHGWLQRHEGVDAAIWASLPVNFREETGRPFSLQAAADYLHRLPPESLAEAWRYITFAPPQTDTPLRRHLEGLAWWKALDFSAPAPARA